MVVTCEECGKNYQIDPLKIKGNKANIRCKVCDHIFPVLKSESKEAVLTDAIDGIIEPAYFNNQVVNEKNAQSTVTQSKKKTLGVTTPKRNGLGLRTKIFLLFFTVPIILFVLTGFLFIDQLSILSTIITRKSSNVVSHLAESIISEKANAVAREVSLYLKTNPTLTQENFFYDKEFMKVAVQKVGKTGYTVLNSAPTENDPWKIRAHPREDLIGSEILGTIKSRLNEKDFITFKKLHDTAFLTKNKSAGYYRFLDGKEKYLAMVPVQGTNYWVLSTTYIDEFTLPMQTLEKEANLFTLATIRIVLIILVAAILLVAGISFLYGLRLSNKIRELTDVTNRFSVGEMSANINLKSKDEIGDLADAITRMQESIRFAYDRLRSRRGK